MTISEEDLRGLSAIERESLLSTDEDDEDLVKELGLTAPAGTPAPAPAANADDGEGGEEGEGDDVVDVVDKLAPAPAPAATPAAAPAPAPAPAADDEADEDNTAALVPQRSTPADVADQRKALRTERAEALNKLLAGEIDQAAFSEVEDRVSDKLDALVRAEASDDTRAQLTQDSMMADYNRELRGSHRDLRAAGLDIKVVGAEFDRAVRMFAGEAGARGLADEPGNLAASKAALAEATEYLLRRHGKTAAAPAPAPAPAPAAAAKPARTPKPVDRSTFPPTLAAVPAAADVTISSEFAHLESLEGAALERALAKMSPEQQERYLT